MKINFSVINEEQAISDVNAEAANEIVGGETNMSLDWNSLTLGKDSGQIAQFRRVYVTPQGTDLNFSWRGWS